MELCLLLRRAIRVHRIHHRTFGTPMAKPFDDVSCCGTPVKYSNLRPGVWVLETSPVSLNVNSQLMRASIVGTSAV